MKWNFFKRTKKPLPVLGHGPDWVIEKRLAAQALADSLRFEHVEGQPLPPWIAHPKILIGSIGWRMGTGETFIHEVFFPYWQKLSCAEQAAYLEKFDLGSDWQDRDKWLASLDANKTLQ
jgi:hypothetical protein